MSFDDFDSGFISHEEYMKRLRRRKGGQNTPPKNAFLLGPEDCYKIEPPKYFMGVSKIYDLAYCLMSKIGDNSTVIFTKQMYERDEKEFDQEVANLVKYFNATLIEEKS